MKLVSLLLFIAPIFCAWSDYKFLLKSLAIMNDVDIEACLDCAYNNKWYDYEQNICQSTDVTNSTYIGYN